MNLDPAARLEDESGKPPDSSREPREDNREPPDDSRKPPDDNWAKPHKDSREPPDDSREPLGGSHEPVLGVLLGAINEIVSELTPTVPISTRPECGRNKDLCSFTDRSNQVSIGSKWNRVHVDGAL
ncbi:uncharacterized protein [Dysidea avara]|uniref:uncharacterized protein n=1 Tax=Dysidea avara TaxID=196820 RepID=UPI003329F22C